MIPITLDLILIPLKGNGNMACVHLALKIMYAITIKWATMTFPLLY